MHSSLYFFRPLASIVYGGSQFFLDVAGGGAAVAVGRPGCDVVV